MWHKESRLNSCGHVYFLKSVDGVLYAGTDHGVFVLGGDDTWTPDPTFPQTTFDVLQGTWGGRCAGCHAPWTRLRRNICNKGA